MIKQSSYPLNKFNYHLNFFKRRHDQANIILQKSCPYFLRAYYSYLVKYLPNNRKRGNTPQLILHVQHYLYTSALPTHSKYLLNMFTASLQIRQRHITATGMDLPTSQSHLHHFRQQDHKCVCILKHRQLGPSLYCWTVQFTSCLHLIQGGEPFKQNKPYQQPNCFRPSFLFISAIISGQKKTNTFLAPPPLSPLI